MPKAGTKRSQPEPAENDEDEFEDDAQEVKDSKNYWVYVLESQSNSNYSYVGYTVNRERRIRQHNGDLKSGGAKYTSRSNLRPWRMVMSMSVERTEANKFADWWTKKAALQLEWRAKHVRKGRSGKGRRPKAHQSGSGGKRARWRTLRFVNRPAVERRLNDIFWLLHNRQKWTGSAPEWKEGRSILVELEPSLITPQLIEFSKKCQFWQPTIKPLALNK